MRWVEHARLAAARAGEDQQRPLAVRDRLALGLVQALQQLLEVLGMRVLGIDSSIDAARPAWPRPTAGRHAAGVAGSVRSALVRALEPARLSPRPGSAP